MDLASEFGFNELIPSDLTNTVDDATGNFKNLFIGIVLITVLLVVGSLVLKHIKKKYK